MRLAVVIVNYRTGSLVCDCLHRLVGEICVDTDTVLVVDNDSGDDSVDVIQNTLCEQGWESWVSLLPVGVNGGFAAGNNVALRWLFLQRFEEQPDYIMLLNPDTIVNTKSIEYLVEFLNNHSDVGVVGSQLQDADHNFEPSARNYPSPLSEFNAGIKTGVFSKLLKPWEVVIPVTGSAFQCRWVSGAAMMVRAEVFAQVGLLDEKFFLYFEELDFCQRVNEAKWQVWLEPMSIITHLEGQATGIQNKRKRRGKYWFNSRRRYFVKHQGVFRWLLADLLWSCGRHGLLVRKLLGFGGDLAQDPLYFARDLLVGDLKALLNGDVFSIERNRGK